LPELKGGIHDLFDVLSELYGARFSMLPVSVESGKGLEKLHQAMFELLDVIRVYTKVPGTLWNCIGDPGDPVTGFADYGFMGS